MTEKFERVGEAVASSATRGFTRSGAEYRASNRPYYDSLSELVGAHRRLFEEEASMTLIGEVGGGLRPRRL
jgi:hypothetical protein